MKKLIAAVLLAAYSSACFSSEPKLIEPNIKVDYRPDISSDEGGFWYKVDKLEKEVKRSPYRITDEAITSYLENMVCKLAGEYCPNIRVYLISNPNFNASMYPNGMMQIWTGLLLRVENEAQLATIIGHEIAHYLRTHQIQQWRSLRDGSAAATFIDIGIAAVTGVYGLGTLAVMGANVGFSRDHEREADMLGLQLMANAGYEPSEAGKLWLQMVHEREVDKSKESNSLFWSTHPPSKERAQTLAESSPFFRKTYIQAKQKNTEAFVKSITPFYQKFMENYFAQQELEQAELLLKKHHKIGFPKAHVHFFEGELHRLRGNENDVEKAIGFYQKATQDKHPLAAAFKQLGYLMLKKKQHKKALNAFNQYLLHEPDASDKAMINYYIKTLGNRS